VHRPSGLCISRQTNKVRTLISSLCLTLIKSRGLIPTQSWHLDNLAGPEVNHALLNHLTGLHLDLKELVGFKKRMCSHS